MGGLLLVIAVGLALGVLSASVLRRVFRSARSLYKGSEHIDDDEPVALTSYSAELEAEVARGVLEVNDVPAYVSNTNSLAYLGQTPLSNWELRVRFRDVERAQRLLAERDE